MPRTGINMLIGVPYAALMNGSSTSAARRDAPVSVPSEIPTTAAMRKPTRAIHSVPAVADHNSFDRRASNNFGKTSEKGEIAKKRRVRPRSSQATKNDATERLHLTHVPAGARLTVSFATHSYPPTAGAAVPRNAI